MQLQDAYEVLESVYVEMDSVLDSVLCGFAGVLVELCRKDDRYVLSETAAGSGDRLLEFSSKDERLVRGTFEKELSALSA